MTVTSYYIVYFGIKFQKDTDDFLTEMLQLYNHSLATPYGLFTSNVDPCYVSQC